MRALSLILYLMILFDLLHAQNAKKFVHDGNNKYKEEKYNEAEENFQKALLIEPTMTTGAFNHADALYKQNNYQEAVQRFQTIAEESKDKKIKSNAYHNLGNALLKSNKIKESIEAYKNALRINPEDDQTRYNLAYAMKKLKQQQNKDQQNKDQQNKDQQNKDQQNKDQQNKDQQNKDQQNKDQQNKDQQNKDQQNKDQQNKDQQNKDQQEKEQEQKQLKREDAKRMLDALNNEEKKVQEKLQKQKMQGQRITI